MLLDFLIFEVLRKTLLVFERLYSREITEQSPCVYCPANAEGLSPFLPCLRATRTSK